MSSDPHRTTFRLDPENSEYLCRYMRSEGWNNMNLALNQLLKKLRTEQPDSKLTASLSNHKE